MRSIITTWLCLIGLMLAACGPDSPGAVSAAPTTTAAAEPAEIIPITSLTQFDAELAKARPGVVLVADFHAEWCGPCKKLAPDLVALAVAHPGKLIVLKVDIDEHPQLASRFQVDSIPLLVTFTEGKESARQVGYFGKDKLAAWLKLP